MILKIRIGKYRITFTIARVVDVAGVNSKLSDGNHILMWDFDNQPLTKVVKELSAMQQFFKLPKIYIFRSSPPNNYLAYCFSRHTFSEARAIIGMTVGVDENFFKWGCMRRRFTSRVGMKGGHRPKLVRTIWSPYPQEVNVAELTSWVKYETLDMHHKQILIKLGEAKDAYS